MFIITLQERRLDIVKQLAACFKLAAAIGKFTSLTDVYHKQEFLHEDLAEHRGVFRILSGFSGTLFEIGVRAARRR
jgi:hypothetical protein